MSYKNKIVYCLLFLFTLAVVGCASRNLPKPFAWKNHTVKVDFSRIVVFGDSLQDNGNLAEINKNVAPDFAHYNNGRFTDGLVATEYFVNALNDRLVGEKLLYTNNAFGGATLEGNFVKIQNEKTNKEFIVPSVLQQVKNFPGKFSPNDLIILDGGGNNLLFLFSDPVKKNANFKAMNSLYNNFKVNAKNLHIVSQYRDIINAIIAKGGQKIIILTVPDVTLTPVFQSIIAKLNSNNKIVSDLVHDYLIIVNSEINDIPQHYREYKNISISVLNIDLLLKAAYESSIPKSYTSSKYSGYAYTYKKIACSPLVFDKNATKEQKIEHTCKEDVVNNYLYLDGVHPTTPLQSFAGEALLPSIVHSAGFLKVLSDNVQH